MGHMALRMYSGWKRMRKQNELLARECRRLSQDGKLTTITVTLCNSGAPPIDICRTVIGPNAETVVKLEEGNISIIVRNPRETRC